MGLRQRTNDRDPGRLVAVNAPDDENPRSRPRDMHDRDRPVLHRMTDDNRGR
jgi:hypothetical protein